MLLHRTKVGKLKGLTYAEVHKIVNNLPDRIGAEYKEIKSKKSQPAIYIVTLYRKRQYDK